MEAGDVDPAEAALNVARLHEMEGRLVREREEKAELVDEKSALLGRLQVNSKLQTPNPKPLTLNPKPQTLNPKP